MKKLLCLIPFLTVTAFASPEVLPSLVCSGVTTSTVAVTASSQVLSAYVNALKVVVTPAATTCTVSIASGMLTMFSGTEVTGTSVVHPMVQGLTNSATVDAYLKSFLASEAITVSAHTATTVTNVTVTVTPVIERNP